MAGDTPVGGGTVDRFRGGDSVGRGAADRYAPAAQRSAGSGLRSLRRAIQSPPSENSDNRATPIVGISLRLPRNRRSDVPLHGACRGRGAGRWQAAWNIADRGGYGVRSWLPCLHHEPNRGFRILQGRLPGHSDLVL